MSQPVYFLPNVSAGQVVDPHSGVINRKVLASHGLALPFGDLRAKGELGCLFDLPKGPEGKSGTLLCYLTTEGDVPDKLGYYPDCQTWHQSGSAWIGWETEKPPTEKDYQRKRQVGGYRLELDDGSKWLIPIIRRPDDTTELPCDMFYGDDGAMKEPVKDAYLEFWQESAEVCGWFFNESGEFGGPGFSKLRAFDLAVRALSINYRYGQAEQRVTKAVNSENFLSILSFTVDLPRFAAVREAEKKSESQSITPITTLGPAAGLVTIDLPEQTCT